MYEDPDPKISNSQCEGLTKSAVFEVLKLVHGWYKAIDDPKRVIRTDNKLPENGWQNI